MARRGNRQTAGKKKAKGPLTMREILMFNTYAALRDESYTLIVRLVEDALKDPELRKKIDYYARQIMKEIAARM